MILEIGCGENKQFKNSIGFDIRKLEGVDIVGDARKLPFEDEYFDHVFSSHVIEHFSHKEVEDVLREWIRVLKIGGTFEMRCPDLRIRALIFAINPQKKDIINIYGEQDYDANYHQCGFSYSILKDVLEDLDIFKLKRIFDGYKGIPFLPRDLHIIGIKK
jgi:predicted SAM-dependent methyltransferase